jgi:hypothetical protein
MRVPLAARFVEENPHGESALSFVLSSANREVELRAGAESSKREVEFLGARRGDLEVGDSPNKAIALKSKWYRNQWKDKRRGGRETRGGLGLLSPT